MDDDLPPAKAAGLTEELAELRAVTTRLRAENARLLELTPRQAAHRRLRHAVENTRTGKAGPLPATRGGWRKGVRHEDRDYLPLSKDVLRAHLTGDVHVGLYPLLDGDPCWWLRLISTARWRCWTHWPT